ncbi:MAG: bifunctional precorrin-2 dehydrogenase/sirohydrochlorin ferrochelatase [Rothia sp. (in: high G+C Gram-positive bacteria)]|nr:bifunctional precorrin-2 dehydrogenase/sirohydrochlorin ferrochelatase [Rothia sp. (in: high G+C Gram-positive bacteria)]
MLPCALRLEGKPVLVVGGGQVAQRRVASLLAAGACVQLVAPEVSAELASWAGQGKLLWRQREFEPGDVIGCWLVLAHTSQAAVNQQVARLCQQRQIWCLQGGNAADSDVWLLAHEKIADDLLIAVTAFGRPQRAQQLLRYLSKQAGQKYV